MKYCSNCGQPLREGVKVCTNCGTPVRNDGPNYKHSEQRYSHQQPRSNKSNKKYLVDCYYSVSHYHCFGSNLYYS